MPRKITFSLDPEDLWTRLEAVDLGGATVPTFSPEDTLLILCVHGSKHRWKRLAWVCDVAETINARPSVDWKRILAQAGELRDERMLFMGLFLANDLLEAPLPEYVLERVRADKVVSPLAERVTEGFFVQVEDPQGPLEGSSFRALYLGMREGLPDKIWYCVPTAMSQSTEDWELVPLPRSMYPVNYLLRLIRLAIKYGRKFCTALFGGNIESAQRARPCWQPDRSSDTWNYSSATSLKSQGHRTCDECTFRTIRYIIDPLFRTYEQGVGMFA